MKLFRNWVAFSMIRKTIDERIHPFQKVRIGHLLCLRSYDRLGGLCAESEFFSDRRSHHGEHILK